jgi:hypothetical protein
MQAVTAEAVAGGAPSRLAELVGGRTGGLQVLILMFFTYFYR